MSAVARWGRLLARWARVLAGRSYYHQRQGLGKAFRPGELAGYFNDLTAKVRWSGLSDADGVPVNLLADGRKIHFVTTVVQKALGHWDQWLLTRSDEHREAFVALCRWLLRRQDARGGWPVWQDLGLALPSAYSAMTQGECISSFVRAWKLTGDARFAEGAQRAAQLMLTGMEDGGPAVSEGGALFLEEVPSLPRSTILNGWIFAIFGLYDLWLAFNGARAKECLERSLESLKRSLAEYDAGYWSFYDRLGHLASPFYHDLHIHQLTALGMIDAAPFFRDWRDRWLAYQAAAKNRARALLTKARQKLREPGQVVVIK